MPGHDDRLRDRRLLDVHAPSWPSPDVRRQPDLQRVFSVHAALMIFCS
jgi:hypothetical protein